MRKYLLIVLMLITVNSFGQLPMSKLIRKASGTPPPPVADTAFVTSSLATSLRNDYGDFVGFGFTVGASNITVTKLGRWVVSGNSGTHTLKIVDGSYSTIVSASINTSGLSVGYNFVSCSATVLTAGTTYYMLSGETNGGDQWYTSGAVTSLTDATITGSYYANGASVNLDVAGSRSYVPVNFKYHL